ncbi:hypothetical protein [Streptomyces sp. ALI-76-A]|uniref:hypothetical protein n=1 Tax=Streptomyces sp. ALI-76-A TaxID=3025736 RepID=UPI00256F5EA5|nr:hypothetical protein [Streptomyces sp. ALI-76-A]MDL5204964.1 hypothetical protein [Streptomyces sp. ALI-76-A]
MKVRILESGSGLLDGAPFPAVGEEVELPTGLALSLINDKRAEVVAEAAETRETAAAAAPEKRGPGRPRKTA